MGKRRMGVFHGYQIPKNGCIPWVSNSFVCGLEVFAARVQKDSLSKLLLESIAVNVFGQKMLVTAYLDKRRVDK
ncbi:hypothetical protein CEXT_249011 [Caerostris extrusa]|uniref:Uncharacterized protein n=1 Tax=Caerostris extrusa TaxID=172846 RepID=A0AAV4RKP7_CAEEX|nr:hypothetical protein CEXT_249011 [Caerostris extrusa]